MKKLCYIATIPAVVNAFLIPHIKAAESKYDITIVCNEVDKELLNNINAHFAFLPIQRKPSIWQDIVLCFRLYNLFRLESFDIVHSIMPKTGMLGMLAAWFSGVPVRIHTFTGQIWANKKGCKRIILKSIDWIIVFFASHILVDSPSQLDFLERERVLRKGQGVVLGNGSICGVDLVKFHPDCQSKKQVRAQLSINQEQIVILYLGRLNKDKGILDLVDAFSQIFSRNQEVFLLLIGDEDNISYADIEIRAGSASLNLRRLPFTVFPQKYMAAADIFALASYREGFGQVLIEAAACSVPTVASRIYGITDAVVDRSTGLLFEMASVSELAQSLETLIKDPDLRRRMGESARERVVDFFDRQLIVSQQLAFYAEVSMYGKSNS